MASRKTRCALCTVALSLSSLTAGTTGVAGQAPANGPVQMTREEDHARTMKLLGLTALPKGAASASAETYDESKANPYPTLPDPLALKSGRRVTTVAMWRAATRSSRWLTGSGQSSGRSTSS